MCLYDLSPILLGLGNLILIFQGTPLPIEIPNVKAGLGNMLLNHSDWKGTYKVPFQGEEEMNIKAFLEQTMEALEADEPANWENCWALECSQNRI
mmetsp:Transcript_7533/g.10630  ORF Transcript_7533/g.10630 Transcript_7533/m.10630 type:complete len:95 (-) Transcript_7533:262-546(-)